ncbi:MAG: nucleoside triphosphate pyrophosphohydrolase [Pseudomonadota bacterium]
MTTPPKPDGTIEPLLQVMRALRDPQTGCPWDLEQTFETIVPYTLEEAHEVADAVSRGNLNDLCDELGDLLLQVVYHARIAEEQDAFDFANVADAITAKMIRRHPHVFGSAAEREAGPTPGMWEAIKATEARAQVEPHAGAAPADDTTEEIKAVADTKAASALSSNKPAGQPAGEQASTKSRLDGIPISLPGLSRAVKLQHKAARVGFDWPDLQPVLMKMREELAELEVELSVQEPNRQAVAEEFGDLLFVMANVARHLKIDPEASLRAANTKFTSRFQWMEQTLASRGHQPEDYTLGELDALWDAAKAAERSASE